MSSCPTRDRLEQWLDLPAGDAEQSELAGHIDACPTCQRLLDELTAGGASRREIGTRDYRPPSRREGPSTSAAPVAVPTTVATGGTFGTPPRLENEIRDLLQRRLRLAALLGLVVLSVLVFQELTGHTDQATATGTTAAGLVLGGAGVLTFLAATVYLWPGRRPPLRRLRVLELLVFAVVVLWS